jgi:hypothetical protein
MANKKYEPYAYPLWASRINPAPERLRRLAAKNFNPEETIFLGVFLNSKNLPRSCLIELETLGQSDFFGKNSDIQQIRGIAKFGEPFTFEAKNALAFKIYPDNRPRNLEIAALQKGLILTLNGKELVEEGAGFGGPIVKYADRTFFCSNANVYCQKLGNGSAVVKKIYFLDAVSEKQIRGASVNDGFYSFFHAAFEKAYLSWQSGRPVFDWMIHLRKALGLQTRFVKVQPRGEVAVTYHCSPTQINVHVDLSAMKKEGCREVLLLNEQGATQFRRYSDTDGAVFSDGQIGAWTQVKSKQASLTSTKTGLCFSLEKVAGATLYRGRELVKDRFSWAGMTYALNPKTPVFDYAVKLSRTPPVHRF